MVEEREGARRRWLYQFDLRTRKRASLVRSPCGDWRGILFIQRSSSQCISAEALVTYDSRSNRDRCRYAAAAADGDDEKSLSTIASAKRRARVLPRDAYVLSDSQPIRDVLCGSANWACPQWGCGASCCAQCLHSAERSVFSGGAVRAARSAYAGTLDVCCARSRSAEEKRVGGKDGHFHCGCLLRRLEVPSCRHS